MKRNDCDDFPATIIGSLVSLAKDAIQMLILSSDEGCRPNWAGADVLDVTNLHTWPHFRSSIKTEATYVDCDVRDITGPDTALID